MSEFDHKTFLQSVTTRAGVYVMLNADGEVLYVGKAKNLKNRLSSYFRASGLTSKTMALVGRIVTIEVTVTATEKDALLLEQNLIKQYLPPYNILLKDDKSYPYIFVSSHEHPRLAFHRGAQKEKGRYYGPYPSGSAVRDSLHLMQKLFKVRQCEDSYYSNRTRPCLQYQIGRCSGPCVNQVDEKAYADDVRRTELFLKGKSAQVINELADDMEAAAEQQLYELAAEKRDQIAQMQKIQASQCIEGETGDIDIVASAVEQGMACVHILFVRGGRVLGSRSYFPRTRLDETLAEVIEAFIAQTYFTKSQEMPKEIIVNAALADAKILSEALTQQAGRKVAVVHRVRANRAKWQALAATAAQQNLKNRLAATETTHQRYRELTKLLELESSPERMECFDISHSSGEATVASCVVFDANGPLKSDYRKFNISDIEGGDDYAAMRQALTRRYKRVQKGEIPKPDILFIDGGKGQLSQAKAVLSELEVTDLLTVGVAKGSDRRAGMEVLIRGDNGKEITLPGSSPALHLIQQIRDESHRFAITGHKAKRDKARKQSTLESIPGVGNKRRKELLRHFGGLQGIKQANVNDLCRVPGISEKVAQDIYHALRAG